MHRNLTGKYPGKLRLELLWFILASIGFLFLFLNCSWSLFFDNVNDHLLMGTASSAWGSPLFSIIINQHQPSFNHQPASNPSSRSIFPPSITIINDHLPLFFLSLLVAFPQETIIMIDDQKNRCSWSNHLWRRQLATSRRPGLFRQRFIHGFHHTGVWLDVDHQSLHRAASQLQSHHDLLDLWVGREAVYSSLSSIFHKPKFKWSWYDMSQKKMCASTCKCKINKS